MTEATIESQTSEMPQYIGTKLIRAKPMTRGGYNALRGWGVPANENPAEDGYLVEYPDSVPNVEGFFGYISWSPKRQFEEAYRRLDGMTFGLAIDALKRGFKVTRAKWRGTCHLMMEMRDGELKITVEYGKEENDARELFVAHNEEMLAEDWVVTE